MQFPQFVRKTYKKPDSVILKQNVISLVPNSANLKSDNNNVPTANWKNLDKHITVKALIILI